jgi:peptidoglycan/LPS O-acetylase OafA/YrhL
MSHAAPLTSLTPEAPSRRVRELDVLRGIAILLVLGHHVGVTPSRLPRLVQAALDRWAMAGWVGVDLFFVLSGFLVSGLLFQEYRAAGRVRVGRFLVRRAFKIYPAFYTLIAITVVVDRLLRRPAGWSPIVHELLFVQNYGVGLWTHTWSLAVEEHFYLLLAALIAGLVATAHRRCATADPFRAIGPLFVAIATIALVARLVTRQVAPPQLNFHLTPTHLRLDSLMCGVALAYPFHFHREWLASRVRTCRPALMLASVVCLAPCLFLPVESPIMQTIGFTLLYLGFGSVVLLAVHRSPAHQASAAGTSVAAALAWLGTYSYSIYLWHMPVLAWSTIALARLAHWLPSSTLAWCLYYAETIVVGVGMTLLIERPALALRDRLTAGGSNAASLERTGGSQPPVVRRTPSSMLVTD